MFVNLIWILQKENMCFCSVSEISTLHNCILKILPFIYKYLWLRCAILPSQLVISLVFCHLTEDNHMNVVVIGGRAVVVICFCVFLCPCLCIIHFSIPWMFYAILENKYSFWQQQPSHVKGKSVLSKWFERLMTPI